MTTTPAPSIAASLLTGTATGPFPTGFKYGAAGDVRVWLELAGVRQPDLTQGSDYTLTGATPKVDGGTVTLAAALVPSAGWDEAAGDRVVIARRTVKSQSLALPDSEGHKPAATEAALDKLMRAAEEAADGLSLTVTVGPGETPPQMPPAAERQSGLMRWELGGFGSYSIPPGKFIVGDAEGNPTGASGTGGADGALREDLAAPGGSDLSGFQRRLGVGQASNLTRVVAAGYIRAEQEFGIVPDGTDKSANLALLYAEHMKSGREMLFDSYYDDINDIERPNIVIAQAVPFRVVDALSYASAFRKGPRLRGVGNGYTTFEFTAANGYMFDVTCGDPDGSEDSFANFRGVLQGYFKGIAVVGDRSKAHSGFIRFRSVYQHTIEDFDVIDLSGHGIFVDCLLGDTDASNQLTARNGRMANGGFNYGYAIKSAATPPHNEISGFATDNVFIQAYGRDECPAILDISQTNPAVVTLDDDAEPPVNGDKIYLFDLAGMTGLDTDVAETAYTVAGFNAGTRTFNLRNLNDTANVDASGLPAYTGGGRIYPRAPRSGAVDQKGQIIRHERLFLTINMNVSLHERGESGLGQDLDYVSCTVENPHGIGRLCTGFRRVDGKGIHVYSNASFIVNGFNRYGHLNDGLTHSISHIAFPAIVVRSTAAETSYTVSRTFGGNVDLQTVDYSQPVLKQFGYAGQKLLVGLLPPVPGPRFLAEVLSGLLFRVRPGNGGNALPLKQSLSLPGGGVKHLTGELTGYRMPPAGITKGPTYPPYAGAWGSAGAALLPNTQYWGYSADAVTYLGRPDIEWWPTAPVADTASGQPVLSGDVTRRYIWSVCTDGAGEYRTTAIGWCNPEFRNGWYYWVDATGADRKKATLPTLAGGGDLDGSLV